VLDCGKQLGLGLLRGQAGDPLQRRQLFALGIGELATLTLEVGLEVVELVSPIVQCASLDVEPLFAICQSLLPALQIAALLAQLVAASRRLTLCLRSGRLGRPHQVLSPGLQLQDLRLGRLSAGEGLRFGLGQLRLALGNRARLDGGYCGRGRDRGILGGAVRQSLSADHRRRLALHDEYHQGNHDGNQHSQADEHQRLERPTHIFCAPVHTRTRASDEASAAAPSRTETLTPSHCRPGTTVQAGKTGSTLPEKK